MTLQQETDHLVVALEIARLHSAVRVNARDGLAHYQAGMAAAGLARSGGRPGDADQLEAAAQRALEWGADWPSRVTDRINRLATQPWIDATLLDATLARLLPGRAVADLVDDLAPLAAACEAIAVDVKAGAKSHADVAAVLSARVDVTGARGRQPAPPPDGRRDIFGK